MDQPAFFGVLEVAWEMTLPGPAGEAPRNDAEAVISDLSSLPFQPYAVHLDVTYVAGIRHLRIDRKLSQMRTPDSPRERVPTPTLITEYALGSDQLLRLMQWVPPIGNTIVYRIAAGMTRQVDVGESGGLYIQGRWFAEGGSTKARWEPTGGATLLWSESTRALELYGEGFTSDELVALAATVN